MNRYFLAASLMLFCTNVSAEWRILTDNSRNNAIEAVGDGAAVRVQCAGSLTVLAVSMGQRFTTVIPTIDGNPLEMAGGEQSRGKLRLYVLSATGILQLINGATLELKGISFLGDKAYGAVSLIGFTSAYNDAKLACRES